jgi:hypothetical protein
LFLWLKQADLAIFAYKIRTPFILCKAMQLKKIIFDLNNFNGRPFASLVRLTQTISGRPGRILFPLPFGQIQNHTFYLSLVHLISFAKRRSLESSQACPVKRVACFSGVGRTQFLHLSAANFSHYITPIMQWGCLLHQLFWRRSKFKRP